MTRETAPVSFRNVSRHFGAFRALDRLNLEIGAGEFVTLLGPSGSGKTTALNILAGFDRASSGEVLIGSRSVGALPPEQRDVGMVFQNFALFPHLSVWDNVAFPLKMRKVPTAELRARVGAALEMVRMSAMAARRPAMLSGGQKQRVALARAVVAEPPVLLMDECLSALDLKLREELQDEIRRIHRSLGATVVFVTHDQGEAMGLSDRIALMNQGQVCQFATPQALYDQPASRFVADFIGRTNLIDADEPAADELGLRHHTPAGRAPGLVAWSLRPEHLQRHPDPAMAAATGTGFTARAEDVEFRGAQLEIRLRLASGRQLRLTEPRRADLAPPMPGADVHLSYQAQHVTELTD